MIAMLLAAQLSAAAVQTQTVETARPEKGGLVQLLPRPHAASCLGSGAGRMEVSLLEPTALYRKGDRPARGLRRWADYPAPSLCQVGTGR